MDVSVTVGAGNVGVRGRVFSLATAIDESRVKPTAARAEMLGPSPRPSPRISTSWFLKSLAGRGRGKRRRCVGLVS